MKQLTFEIKTNEQIAKNIYRMQLCGDTTGILPGQFVNIRVEGQFLRRPISVCNVAKNLLILIAERLNADTDFSYSCIF